MAQLRLQGPDFTLEHTSLNEHAIDAQNSRLTLPNHMPVQAEERCLLTLDVMAVGTTLTAQWLPEGQKHLAKRKPENPETAPRVLFHATVNQLGRYCVFATTPRSYNCHWVLWMHHPDMQPYRFRSVWGLENYRYGQRVLT